MTTITNTVPTGLEDALYTLSIGDRLPSATLLDELVRRHPKYANELTDAAISIVLDVLSQGDLEEYEVEQNETSPAVSRAMSHFHNRIYQVEKAAKPAPVAVPAKPAQSAREAPTLFVTYNKNDVRTLSEALGVNTVFIMKLRDRLVEPDSISKGFMQFTAEKIGSTVELLWAHFSAPPVVAANAQYKAERKPEVRRRQSFEEAVKTSGMTAEQQEQLLKH